MTNEELLRERVAKLDVRIAHLAAILDGAH